MLLALQRQVPKPDKGVTAAQKAAHWNATVLSIQNADLAVLARRLGEHWQQNGASH